MRWRARGGGHDVPEDKIRARYDRNKTYIAGVVTQVDEARIFDSSKAGAPARCLLRFEHGLLRERVNDIPAWAKPMYGVWRTRWYCARGAVGTAAHTVKSCYLYSAD